MRRLRLPEACGLAASLLFAGAVRADILVTPSNLQGWNAANLAGSGAVAITTSQPRSGSGSLEFSSSGPSAKADFSLVNLNPGGFGFLTDLTALGFDWRRDSSSTANANLAPALRLGVYDPISGAVSYLIWEKVYQTVNGVNTDTWNSEDVLHGYFWQRAFSPSRTIDAYSETLNDWAQCTQTDCTITDGDGDVPAPVGPSAWIFEFNVGIGSGWSGDFRGEVDNFRFGFGEVAVTTYNFEPDALAAVPEPGSLLLLVTIAGLVSKLTRSKRVTPE